jgi:cysteine desulfurase
MKRNYLDYNATAPIRPEVRDAMITAMDFVGNPSSVHSEGRAAKAIVEKARSQIASSFGADGADIVFTSGATEAAALACAGRGLYGSDIEHDAVSVWTNPKLITHACGRVEVINAARCVLQVANSETGIVQSLPKGLAVTDATQAFGKLPLVFNWLGAEMALISAHKIGGPKGIGALVLRRGLDFPSQIRGGGQEMGRRAGTENVVAIAGFGAAAEAAATDLTNGVWQRVEKIRNILESTLETGSKDITFIGREGPRLPNTSCFAVSGWKGETQVMLLDLAGFAISAGSACSSGKVKSSRVLRAMGYCDEIAASSIRVSLGPDTTETDVTQFADVWLAKFHKFRARAA